MNTELPVVTVHSVAEAYLYLMTLRCPLCGKGPVREAGEITMGAAAGPWTLKAACAACQSPWMARFEITPTPTREQAQSDQINATSQRSQAIDLAGWLTLFQSIVAASEKQAEAATRRQLAHEAAQCLDEAMKFYEGDNEMPPLEAFFSDESRRRFRDHPGQFARSKWRQRRLMLPDARRRAHAEESSRRRWWQIWRG